AMEPEFAADPMLGEVGWSWLTDALAAEEAPYHSLSGTLTRVLSETFGGLELRSGEVALEIRASWRPPPTDLAPPPRTLTQMTCQAAGLPSVPDNVSPMKPKR